jgi:probable phosphoglycerate mutase
MLVRHGQTVLTTARRFSGGGVEGPPLDETGLQQAARMAARLEGSGVVSVIASPMVRTRQTAEIIAARLGVALRVDDGWREVDFGAWEGLTLGEISEAFPAETAAWHESTANPPPSGESLDAMSLRVAVARDRAVARFPGQRVVVVTHSMPVRALIRGALGAPPLAMFRLQPAPGSLSQLDTYNDGTQAVTSFSQLP